MRIEEKFAVSLAVVVSVVIYAFVPNPPSIGFAVNALLKYFAFAVPKSDVFPFFLVFFYGFLLWMLYRALFNFITRRYFGFEFTRAISWKKMLIILADLARAVAVIALTFLPFAVLLAALNYQLRLSGIDPWLWRADEIVLGWQPFIMLPTILSHPAFANILYVAYASLSYVMGATLVVLFIISRKYVFRWALLSFIILVAISFPVYALLPCQDPGNYFLRNLRAVPFPRDVTQYLAAYYPSLATANLITKIEVAETNVENDYAVPISCFPSMHAAWGILCVVFLSRLNRYMRTPLTLWLMLMLLGGMFFAQHYFVDYLVAVPVAVISMVLARWFLVREIGKNVDVTRAPLSWKTALKETFLS